MVIVCAILLAMITTGTNAELGQECRYERIVEVDKYGNTNGKQTYTCKTAPREVVTKTVIKKVPTCMAKFLFGFDCDETQPEGDDLSHILSMMVQSGIIR